MLDEYNLADAFLNLEEVTAEQEKDINLNSFHKIPFADLSSFGGAIAEMIPAFRTATTTSTTAMEGLFRAYNPETGAVLQNLQTASKKVAGRMVGSFTRTNGQFDAVQFEKVKDVVTQAKTVAAVNPATIIIAATLYSMNKKLDKIEENQEKMMRFLEEDKKTSLEGTFRFLTEVFNNYKHNWNNDRYKTSVSVKTQDIKQESEHNILFYRKQIEAIISKKKLLENRGDVRNNMKKLIEEFCNYRLALYLYSFSSLLEVILIENNNAKYLSDISGKIKEYASSYTNLYSSCFNWVFANARRSIETGAMTGLAKAAEGLGKAINKIPIVERGQLDENLIEASKKLNEFNDSSVDNMLSKLVQMSNSGVYQFSDLIDLISDLHNGESEVLVDNDNLYVKATATA